MTTGGNKTKSLTSSCPFCAGELAIKQMTCLGCRTQIESELRIPSFFRLPEELQEFVLVFLRCRGNIREVEKVLKISYPTVCKRLDLVNSLLGNSNKRVDRKEILEQLERGEITAKDAIQLLKGNQSE